MLVRAKGKEGVVVGYYNHQRRRGGDVFELKDKKHFSKSYMVEVATAKESDGPDREAIKAQLVELGVEFAGNTSTVKLVELLEKTLDEKD